MAGWADELEIVMLDPPNAGSPVASQTGSIVPKNGTYVRSNFSVPDSDSDSWGLSVALATERTMSLEELTRLDTEETQMVLECAGNGRTLMRPVPTGIPWTLGGATMTTMGGVRLAEFLKGFEIPRDTVELVFTGADRGIAPDGREISYEFSLTHDDALHGDAFLAWTMAGEPLSREHGAPLRLVVPGQYAMKSVKWLRAIRAVSVPFRGHFVRKYRYYGDTLCAEGSAVGAIQVRSVIASPTEGDRVGPENVLVMGSAWSSGSPIASVVVSGDGGETWSEAILGAQPSGYAAVPWQSTIPMSETVPQIVARATDADGLTQPIESRWNANGYGNNVVHRVNVTVT